MAEPTGERDRDAQAAASAAGSGTSERPELFGAIETGGRRTSVGLIRLVHAMAGRFGMNPTDMQCWSLLQISGPMTPGRLARLTGLTSGAITAVIDRLERDGYVRRERHPEDRRKVMVAVRPREDSDISRSFLGLREAMIDLHEGYSDDELRLITRWLDGVNEVLERLAEQNRRTR
ncbi:DNA-binding MarR family transcriptional regulator [Spinactinospora alkalitolerans]|uniref:DNA-binding MarR family transcriptional regulator n=1 Tax=Spinactinospora alkalitolerans TaxID=687207 RepID=A0A852TPH1_9ACTN|nr:MarR family transcriptional regulator [Spinactinospora alkalitolerans]NYE45889.1 DNA-binding MarR family transcriptional regulator [Spinactinospora alkalitolerans]